MFVSRLDETRVTGDEKRGIQLISEAFGAGAWQHSVIVFTHANNVKPDVFSTALQKRTQLIRQEIAKHSSQKVARAIPSVAVDNTSETTPDGKLWLGKLYTKVFVRTSMEGHLLCS